MKSNRRNFLKTSGLAGIGLAGGVGIINAKPVAGAPEQDARANFQQRGKHFNMSGYAAPKIALVLLDWAIAAPAPSTA
jgi:hypothetical protein